MIVVIADDLSGATELAGAAANFGLHAEVHSTFSPETDADVVAVDTDTRSKTSDAAAHIVREVARAVMGAKPSWIYKKTDSVLRGNVRAEIEAIRSVTCQSRALYIPANPSRNRVIREGTYYVNGILLAETAFAHDPEHPRWTSRVAELLGVDSILGALCVPDIATSADIDAQAQNLTSETLIAGGVDFFQALLKCRLKLGAAPKDAASEVPTDSHTLLVCGSAAAWDAGRDNECAARGIPIVALPEDLFAGAASVALISQAADEVTEALTRHHTVMLAIGRPSTLKSPLPPSELSDRLIEVVGRVVSAQAVGRIFLEGGATAAALLKKLGWTRLAALPAEFVGTAVLRPLGGPLLYIKPGSYPWPDVIW